MAKEFAKSQACAAKTLYAVLKEMQKRGGRIPSKDIRDFVENNVQLTEWESAEAGKMQYVRWYVSMQFYSIDYNKAGFIVKKNGFWYLTPEGEEALKLGEEGIMRKANNAYREWKNAQDSDKVSVPDEKSIEDDVANDIKLNIEDLESKAYSGIQEYIKKKTPYEYQDMVAALLRAMGYYTPFIAPKGKDGGVDVIAYLDPLGAQTPRIKVQVKHRPETTIGAPELRALLGVLKAGDIALFVTSGTFSPDARNTAVNAKEFIRIIDGDEFIAMWQEYYDKMSDDDKNMLPLKRIAFIGSNEQ